MNCRHCEISKEIIVNTQTVAAHAVSAPTKEQVRAYMDARTQSRQAPPAGEEIRRQLGWTMGGEKHVDFER